LRSSLLIETPETTVLIDSSPDLRQQLLAHNVQKIDAVLYTHAHSDHTNGIDDLRPFHVLQGKRLPVYSNPAVLQDLARQFPYAFEKNNKETNLYWPFLEAHPISSSLFRFRDLEGRMMRQDHHYSLSYGFRFGDFAYSTDVCVFPEETFQALSGIRTWIVECSSPGENPSHASLPDVLKWVERLRPERTILTHMNHTMDYATVSKLLPAGMELAFDGLVVEGLSLVA
jgi:phosphoribosyl 1,2-cyclic phosphate phosphodiesterase